MSSTATRTARSLVAVGVAGTATVFGIGAASAAPTAPTVDRLATSTTVRPGVATSLSAAVARPVTIDLGDLLRRPPYGCFVCGLGGFPPFDEMVLPGHGL